MRYFFKNILIIIVLLFVVFLHVAAKEKKKGKNNVKEEVKVEIKKIRLAIMDFESIGKGLGDGEMGRAVAENLRTELIQTGKFIVIERSSILKVFEEQQFQFSGAIDQETAVKVGKITGAERLVMGSLTKFGTTFTINIRFIDVETGIATKAEKLRCKNENDIPIIIEGIVKLILGEEWSRPQTVKIPGGTGMGTFLTPPRKTVTSAPSRARGNNWVMFGMRFAQNFAPIDKEEIVVPGLSRDSLYGEADMVGGYFLFTNDASIAAFEIAVDYYYKEREITGFNSNNVLYSSYYQADAKWTYILGSMSLLLKGNKSISPYVGAGLGMGFWKEKEIFQLTSRSTKYVYEYYAWPIPTLLYTIGLDLVLGKSITIGAGYRYMGTTAIEEIDQYLDDEVRDDVAGDFTVKGSCIDFHLAIHF